MKKHWIVFIFIVVLTALIILPFDHSFSHFLNEYAAHAMIFLMVVSIYYLVKNDYQLLLGSLCCAGAIALFLKSNTDLPLKLAQERMLSSFTYASVDLDQLPENNTGWSNRLARINPDILSFSNVDERWAQILYDSLTNKYSNYRIFDRIDGYGMAIFSRYPIEEEAVLESKMIPMHTFKVALPFSQKRLRILMGHIVEAKDPDYTDYFEKQMGAIKDFVLTASEIPLLVGGKFEVVPWNFKMSQLKHKLKLQDSRRNYFHVRISSFGWPYMDLNKSNIWYNEFLECVRVDNIGFQKNPIGLISSYQIK